MCSPRNMYHNQRYMVDATRDTLSYLSGGNMIGYISSISFESGHSSLYKIADHNSIIRFINKIINSSIGKFNISPSSNLNNG